MTKPNLRILQVGAKISDQGQKIINMFLDRNSDVVIGASAGTGKTTLLTNIIAEAVIREIEAGNSRPFDSIIAVTFTVEASRQMKEKTRELLLKYNELYPIHDFNSLLYNLEQNSWISTIDSLTQKILRLVALDKGLPPEIDVIDNFEDQQIRNDVLEEIRTNYNDEYIFLQSVTSNRTAELLNIAYGHLSRFVISPDEFIDRLEHSFKLFYSGHMNNPQIKQFNKIILDNFKIIFQEYVKLLRSRYLRLSSFSYDDLRREIVEFFRSGSAESKEWLSLFEKRFSLFLIDEFQDTSYAQTEFLSYLIGETSHVFLIGDIKQSIFTWRNADPAIFASIIEAASKGQKDPYFERYFTYFAITENYRSVEPLVDLVNVFFSNAVPNSIFSDKKFTGGLDLPNEAISAKTELPDDLVSQPYIHCVRTAARASKHIHSEVDFVISVIHDILNGKSRIKVRRETESGMIWDDPKLGDCAILISSRTAKWRRLKNKLTRLHIPYVMLQDQGFYQRPEISLIIDFLEWLGDPFKKDALLRILRSPFVGASDYLLRVLVSKNFRLDLTCDEIASMIKTINAPDKMEILKHDLVALKRVMNLKRNLRWSREGRKAALVEAILQSSHFREILMLYPEGEQSIVNLGRLCDIIDYWEEEEIISYNALVNRLKYYRRANPSIQSQAVLSDLENEDVLKIATIHATKGLEFPIVFVFDVSNNIESAWSGRNVTGGFLPVDLVFSSSNGAFIHLRQFTPNELTDQQSTIDLVYKAPFNLVPSKFKDGLLSVYNSFVSEKWRLYYVALTRARDHIFHGYYDSKTKTWGTEFSRRKNEFLRHSTNNISYVREVKISRNIPPLMLELKPVINYRKIKFIKDIEQTFVPSVIDPTHVYDLIFCPRRYQYGTLMNAAGSRCNELGYSPFSHVFGTVIHKLVEAFDFQNGDVMPAIKILDTIDYLKKKERRHAKDAIYLFKTFAKKYGLIGNDVTMTEKQIHVSFDISGRKVEFSGVIDLLVISDDSIKIYDIKTNYPIDNPDDPQELRCYNEFIRKHHEYQLFTYKKMLEKMGYSNIYLYIIALNQIGAKPYWDLHPLTNTHIDIVEKLKRIIPLKVNTSGLEKTTSSILFCKVCEYFSLCDH